MTKVPGSASGTAGSGTGSSSLTRTVGGTPPAAPRSCTHSGAPRASRRRRREVARRASRAVAVGRVDARREEHLHVGAARVGRRRRRRCRVPSLGLGGEEVEERPPLGRVGDRRVAACAPRATADDVELAEGDGDVEPVGRAWVRERRVGAVGERSRTRPVLWHMTARISVGGLCRQARRSATSRASSGRRAPLDQLDEGARRALELKAGGGAEQRRRRLGAGGGTAAPSAISFVVSAISIGSIRSRSDWSVRFSPGGSDHFGTSWSPHAPAKLVVDSTPSHTSVPAAASYPIATSTSSRSGAPAARAAQSKARSLVYAKSSSIVHTRLPYLPFRTVSVCRTYDSLSPARSANSASHATRKHGIARIAPSASCGRLVDREEVPPQVDRRRRRDACAAARAVPAPFTLCARRRPARPAATSGAIRRRRGRRQAAPRRWARASRRLHLSAGARPGPREYGIGSSTAPLRRASSATRVDCQSEGAARNAAKSEAR